MKTLSLVMIVKNESKVIERCFDSVKDYIDYWVICDTGSTDGTQELIQSYFKKHKIPGILYNHTWENFGHNRSLAVQAAKGTSDFLLLMDADFIFVPKDIDFKNTLDTNVEAYHVGYEGPLDFKQLLLVRGDINWYYKGVTHEYITNELFEKREKLISSKTCTFFTFDHKADGGSRSDKFERDIRLLKEALEKEPDNVRYMFYLAQSYRDTQQFEEAIQWYSKRIEKGGWPEEVYFSMYQRGLCKVFCKRDFEEYRKDLWEAYQYRPSRLEALYVLLVECRKNNKFDLGYKYGIGSINTPYPEKDYLFVQSPIYKYHIWNEIAFHCSKMNKPHISIQLYNRIHEQKNVPEKDTQQFANNYTLFVKQYRELQEKEKKKEQKVGIIIVNRNETEETDRLIQYLQKNIQIACDVILIDNGSTVKSSFTTISLQSSINKRNALLMGIEYVQTLEVLHNRRYTTIGFMEPSCVFQNSNTDCIQEIQNTLYKDTTLVGVHPFVLGTTEYPFIHTSYTKHQVSYIPSICCFYKAEWLYNNLFSKANVEEGFEIELGYKARDKKIIVDHTHQVECSYVVHEPTHYFMNTYGKDYVEKLYTNISSNYEQEEKRNVEMVIEKKKKFEEKSRKLK